MSVAEQGQPLRIVTFNVLPAAYGLVTQWAAQTGHQIVLVVTTPGPSTDAHRAIRKSSATRRPMLTSS